MDFSKNNYIENELGKISKIKKKNISYNLTHSSPTTFLYPKNYNEVKKIISYLNKSKNKILIKTGSCSHGDKTNLQKSELAISLSRLKRIIKFDKKKETLTAQSGIGMEELFYYLKKRNYTICNIPGGRAISLGGSISGNVHGRPAMKNYENFGDNVISLKVMFENGVVKLVTRKNKSFYKIIGGLGLFAIILEAKLKIRKIENNTIEKITTTIQNKEEFKKYQKNLKRFYGYINPFNINELEGHFIHFIDKKDIIKKRNHELKKYILFNFFNFIKLWTIISFFINNLTLKIFYNFLFILKKMSGKRIKKEIINFEKSIYFIDYNQVLPYFFRGGMIEIQFSVGLNKLYNLILHLKKISLNFNVFPLIFVLKKIDMSNKNYMFNFPKYNFSVSLLFSKKTYNNNRSYFKNLYKTIFKNKCNLYVTKDETFIENIDLKNERKLFKSNLFLKNKIFSSDFKEKVIKIIKERG